MRQEIELRVIIQGEVNRQIDPKIVAESVRYAIQHEADDSADGLWDSEGYTECITVEPIKKGE